MVLIDFNKTVESAFQLKKDVASKYYNITWQKRD